MPHFIDIKKKLKVDILAALTKAENLDYNKTVAKFSLDTGFSEKTIKKVLSQMHQLSYIVIDKDVISFPVTVQNVGNITTPQV